MTAIERMRDRAERGLDTYLTPSEVREVLLELDRSQVAAPTRPADQVAFARQFAVERHGTQKYGDHPYVYHLDRVAQIVSGMPATYTVVAYLHDVVEDTDTTAMEVANHFGPLVGDAVALVSDQPGANRRTRKELTNRKLKHAVGPAAEIALVVKLADRLANVREAAVTGNADKLEMYKREHLDFEVAVKRPSHPRELWAELKRHLGLHW